MVKVGYVLQMNGLINSNVFVMTKVSQKALRSVNHDLCELFIFQKEQCMSY